jgi:hypothetical protein
MLNPFTKKAIPVSFQNLKYNKSITLKPEDPPYFAVRSSKTPAKIQFGSTGFDGNPFEPIAEQFATLSFGENGPTWNEMTELDFLRLFSLVTKKNNTYYIHPKAKIFYDGNRQDKQAFTGKIQELLKTYTLPGRYWRAYYSRLYLPDAIHLTHRLDLEMQQVEEELLALEDK